MGLKNHFWESAKFTAALGMIAKGAALAYGEMTGKTIDAEQFGQLVEQVAGLAFTAATSVATLISIYQGAKATVSRVRAFFSPAPLTPEPEAKPEMQSAWPPPWWPRSEPTNPQRKDSL